MPTKKPKQNPNGSGNLPTAKDFVLPKKLTEEDKELLKASREAMEALAAEKKKYGDRLLSCL